MPIPCALPPLHVHKHTSMHIHTLIDAHTHMRTRAHTHSCIDASSPCQLALHALLGRLPFVPPFYVSPCMGSFASNRIECSTAAGSKWLLLDVWRDWVWSRHAPPPAPLPYCLAQQPMVRSQKELQWKRIHGQGPSMHLGEMALPCVNAATASMGGRCSGFHV